MPVVQRNRDRRLQIEQPHRLFEQVPRRLVSEIQAQSVRRPDCKVMRTASPQGCGEIHSRNHRTGNDAQPCASLLVKVDPQFGIHHLVRNLKGVSSHHWRREFASLRSRLPTLWTNSYFVPTVSGAPVSMITDGAIAANCDTLDCLGEPQ